ncbi:MAG TPA: type II secretion system F family protein [Candidatus Paceibacterota bacterium]|nr:type II secretion system F family protein [Candidatus Paceibacterota bacterium]
MLFNYKAIDSAGSEKNGSIEAINIDVAINGLQRRGLIISEIKPAEDAGGLFGRKINLFQHVSNKEIVILSRQMSTLFSAQVSALRIFRLLSTEVQNETLRNVLTEVADDLQGGSTISKALAKHPKVFSIFYVNMVKAGEESGKLDETFIYLADYLDRNYAVTSKARNALIYPAFVIFTFVAVMVLMLTLVIPKIGSILTGAGQQIPIYTRIIIAMSSFMVNYGLFLLIALIILGFFAYYYTRGAAGKEALGRVKLDFPYVGTLYRKLYLSRIADNMNTLLVSGIPMIKVIELTSSVVDNIIYENILNNIMEAVKGGSALSDAMGRYPEIPSIMVQMVKIGEETGELGHILDTLAKFYQREVVNAVDTLVDLIEPVMIVLLGLGVAFLLASVLIPIYNISSAI